MTASNIKSLEPTVALGGPAGQGAAGAKGGPEPADRRVEVGARVGRYLVLEHIGRGAMGVVVRAYDPKLRREIALKLVRPRGGIDGPRARARLLREAQSLARLSDPHVVAVYDAELDDDGLHIAMEYVEGASLRTWMGTEPRPWTESLPILLACARGLAAAHAEGIVHRDIKPDNVLVGPGDRVRLTDFGLARPRSERSTSEGRESSDGDPEPPDPDEVFTEAGTIMGTPAYMAPEQLTGEASEDLGDQYALCVMAWEVLYGDRPFRGKDAKELYRAKRLGTPARPSARVPEWLHAAIVRGLSVDPRERWPSVRALLEAMSRGRVHARRRRIGVGLAGVVCLGLAGLGWQRWDRSTRVAACEREGATIRDVWNEDARAVVHEALSGTQVSYAAQTADKVMPWIDAHADAWQAARTGACVSADVQRSWTPDDLRRARWCLDERRLELDALVGELSRAEQGTAAKAVQAAAGLASIDPCEDVELLRRLPAPPDDAREEITATRAIVARASAASHTGAYDEARRIGAEATEAARAVAWAPLSAEAGLVYGDALSRTGDLDGAESAFEAAFFDAVQASEGLSAAALAEELVYLVGYRRARHDEGLRWSRHAAALLEGQPDPGQLRLAKHLDNRAGIVWARGDYDAAIELNERALALREAALGADHPGIAPSLNNLANSRAATGAFDEARAMHERAIAIWERALGPDHPMVAASLSNLGGVLQQMGRFDEAQALAERALRIREAALGADHADVADSLNNLAGIAMMRGEIEEAGKLFRRAARVSERALGPDHPDVARGLYNLANVEADLENYEDAKSLAERALRIRRTQLGPDHPEVAQSLNSLAGIEVSLGDKAQARAHFDEALATWERSLGPEHPHLAYALVSMAELAMLDETPADAVPLAERAVRLREAAELPPKELARARFLLAQALWDSRGDRARARTLAQSARDGYASAGEAGKERREEADAWLAEHPPPR